MSKDFLNDSNNEQMDHKKRYSKWWALGLKRQGELLLEYHQKGYKTGLDLGQWIEKKTGIPVEDQPPDNFR
jgi:hypothetical protein